MIVGGHNDFAGRRLSPWFRPLCSDTNQQFRFFLFLLLFGSFFCSTRAASILPDHSFRGRRAQGLSRLAQPPEGLGLDSPEHGGTLDGSGCSIAGGTLS
jgi:hypothetical protein